MEIINWVLDAILFAKSGVADVIDVSWFICDGPQLSMKPLAERDRPSGREANGMNTEQGTGEPPSLHRALYFCLSVPSLGQPPPSRVR